MKILILANNDVGLYQFRKELIAELLKQNMVIISLPYGPLVEPLKQMGCKFINTPVDRRGINPITDLRLLISYWKIIMKESPEMVITYTIKPNIYGGCVCRIKKVPYSVNITGLGTAFESKGLLRKIVTEMYKISLERVKTVFFENAENLQVFVEDGIVKQDKACLLNGAGVNLEHFHVVSYPADDGIIRFLFIGRVMKEKGIDELFAAMRKLRADGVNCLLDVLGDYEEDYKAKIEQYELEGWLNYHGFHTDVRPFIADCHCFVLPSWHEGMANTNLECAASGRPIITSKIHGCLEAVEEGVSGYHCEKQNAEDLYRCLKKFLKLPYNERKTMGLAGRSRMEKLFNRKQIVLETIRRL